MLFGAFRATADVVIRSFDHTQKLTGLTGSFTDVFP
jgi:hypothetical protein